MGSGPSVDTSNKKIVIIGGGYGGAYLAYKLVSKGIGQVKLIEPKEGMFHSMGALRTSVDGRYAPNLCVTYAKELESCHIKASATSIDTKNNTVTLSNGETVEYTELVIACGSSSPFPGKLGKNNVSPSNKEIFQMYADFRKEIQQSKKIVLVGSGAVGIELAGEIKTDYPEKEVTIVSSSQYLASSKGNPAFQKAVENGLKKKSIEVILGERVANLSELKVNKNESDQVVKTEGGKEISCDLVVPCTGTKLNSEFCRDAFGDVMTDAGALQVDEYLKVKGHENVYALGDVTDVPEEKMAYSAKLHADVLFSTFKGKPRVYKTGDFVMSLPIGRNGGVTYYKGSLLGDFMTKMFKSKDLFSSAIWGDLGVKPPKAIESSSAV